VRGRRGRPSSSWRTSIVRGVAAVANDDGGDDDPSFDGGSCRRISCRPLDVVPPDKDSLPPTAVLFATGNNDRPNCDINDAVGLQQNNIIVLVIL
jgi:hypothetical protein